MAEPLTITQALLSLQRGGLERLEAQLLLLHVLKRTPAERSWLVAHGEETLAPTHWQALEALARRRLANEPIAYLTGCQTFYGLTLHVNRSVLVPRPDTETLVDWTLEVLPGSGGRLLDLGTGSGAIALAVKSERPGAEVVATDRSQAALDVARSNARRLALDVRFHQGDWFSALPPGEPAFDCVVANPPYIAASDAHLIALRSEPQEALVSGPDGLADLRHIVNHASGHLRSGGWLVLEHGHDQADLVRSLLLDAGFADVASRRDLNTIERCSGGKLRPKEHST